MCPTPDRRISLLDRVLTELDTALRVLGTATPAARPNPALNASPVSLNAAESGLSAALMRVNHAGEIAAQALYRGQAFVAREPGLRAELWNSAADEHDHLAWCRTRVAELGQATSRLAPVWYAGSFLLGAAAGLAGDGVSLGFLAETERQVTEHLDGHLGRLPPGDEPSRRIVTQMRADELGHRQAALDQGGMPLPGPVRAAMGLAARVMTTLAHRL